MLRAILGRAFGSVADIVRSFRHCLASHLEECCAVLHLPEPRICKSDGRSLVKGIRYLILGHRMTAYRSIAYGFIACVFIAYGRIAYVGIPFKICFIR